MKRLIVVYNPRSSRFKSVKSEIFVALRKLKGYTIGKFEVEPTDVDKNARKLARLLRDDDLLVAAGGDATGAIGLNAIMLSGKDVVFGALPYGNFNDIARTLRLKKFEQILEAKKIIELWPLDILVNEKHWRYTASYVTIGMTAEAVRIFDETDLRADLRKGKNRKFQSYFGLAKWYFSHRNKKVFLPEFKLNGKKMPAKTSDYCALNGRSMAGIMKGGEYYLDKQVFWSKTGELILFRKLFALMFRSILFKTPGAYTKKDVLKFNDSATVTLQAEGEYSEFADVNEIEVKKAEKCIKMIQA